MPRSPNPIWNFFVKMDNIDKRRVLCKECGNAYSLGSDRPKQQSITGLKSHLRTRHKDIYRLFTNQVLETEIEKSAKRIKWENAQVEYAETPALADSDEPADHLEIRHKDIYRLLTNQVLETEIEKSAKRIKWENAEPEYAETPALADSDEPADHLEIRHKDIYRLFTNQVLETEIEKSAKRIKWENAEPEYAETPALADSDEPVDHPKIHPETIAGLVTSLWPECDLQNGDMTGSLLP